MGQLKEVKTKKTIKQKVKRFFKRLGIGILLIAILFGFIAILDVSDPYEETELFERKYKIQLSNWIGSKWYECDSVIWVNDNTFKLLNRESNEPHLLIQVPDDVVVRIYLNKDDE